MATPHVAGVAALHWEKQRQSNPNVLANVVATSILSSCNAGGFVKMDDAADYGAGLIQAPGVKCLCCVDVIGDRVSREIEVEPQERENVYAERIRCSEAGNRQGFCRSTSGASGTYSDPVS